MKLKVNDKIKIKDRNQVLKITKITMEKKTKIATLVDDKGKVYQYLLKDLERSIETKCQIEKL